MVESLYNFNLQSVTQALFFNTDFQKSKTHQGDPPLKTQGKIFYELEEIS